MKAEIKFLCVGCKTACLGGVTGLRFTWQAQYFVEGALLGIPFIGGRCDGFVTLAISGT